MAAAAPLPLASRLRRRLAGALRRLATAACVPLALAPLAVAPARAADDAQLAFDFDEDDAEAVDRALAY